MWRRGRYEAGGKGPGKEKFAVAGFHAGTVT